MSRWIICLVVAAACGGRSSASPDANGDAASIDGQVDPPPFRCDFAECSGGFARTCNDDPQTLDCTAFGATCGSFTDSETAAPFTWCDCGMIAELDGFCLAGRFGVACYEGLGGLSDCGVGYACVPRPFGPFGIGCECDNAPDGICPGVSCSSDPDCSACTPNCGGRACGDNGCGGECGTCDFGDSCTAAGQCEAICVPDCTNRQCGDDGCGGSCGTCEGTCSSTGTCQGACVPSCTGAVCGNDGCGGSCGSCTGELVCDQNRQCGCDFFASVKYNFTIAPQVQFPTTFSWVSVNVTHINVDGSEGTPNGEVMGFTSTRKQAWSYSHYGCRPKIKIRRSYALSGKSCEAEEIIEGRTDFVIPAPTIIANGNCTAPPL